MSMFGTPSPASTASASAPGSAPAFGLFSTPAPSPASGGSVFGGSGGLFGSTPTFGASSGGGLFGSTTPAFGASGGTPSLFGSVTPQQGASSSQGAFGQNPAFGQTQSLFGQTTVQQQAGSLFGQAQQTPGFGQAQQTPAFGQTPQTSTFGQSLFGGQQQQFSQMSQQQQPSMFQSPLFGTPQPQVNLFNSGQLTTQMAPVAPVMIPLPDREIQAIVDAYKDDPGNLQDGFKHLLLSVTDPAARVKPVGVSDIMWAEAMNKLEGMDSVDRERLWPELVHGFKDLSRRLKLQDEVIAADVQRLQATESNVKLLRRHFETDTLPWIQRLRQKEQELQRRLLKVMRIVEALEVKGFHMALTRGEAKLGDHMRVLTRQLHGASAELPRRVEALLSVSRMQVGLGGGSQAVLLGPGKIDNQSLVEMHEVELFYWRHVLSEEVQLNSPKVLRQQTEAIARLATVLKRDMRDIEIIMTEDREMADGHFQNDLGRHHGSHAILKSSNKYPSGYS